MYTCKIIMCTKSYSIFFHTRRMFFMQLKNLCSDVPSGPPYVKHAHRLWIFTIMIYHIYSFVLLQRRSYIYICIYICVCVCIYIWGSMIWLAQCQWSYRAGYGQTSSIVREHNSLDIVYNTMKSCLDGLVQMTIDSISYAISEVTSPDIKVHEANMGPAWVLSAPCGSHVGLMNLAIWVPFHH